ncbi:MAG: hypothetical protein H6667_18380 [Ardenticatenaceae bacterium]|nr:hypothetical protein [Ardenticatenaceae bacterium]MCB9445761.1 hypothetical protein [Ardenticatenaceae bacterium]
MEFRWLRWLTGLMLGTAVTLIILIAAGTFDPKPIGKLQWERPLPSQTIAANSQYIIWLAAAPEGNYSLCLMTSYQSGESDLLYGLAIGDEEDFWVTAVSPLGYAAVWEQQSALSVEHFAFQPWPHVRPDENEIWLNVVDGRIIIRLNRELLWQGEVDLDSGQIGLWLESFGETAVVNFPTLQIFAVKDTQN